MTTVDSLVADYLTRLDQAATDLPPDRRSELLEGIGEHIAAARAAGAAADEAAVRTLLDRLGEPAEIVAAAQEDVGPGWRSGAGWSGAAGRVPGAAATGPAPTALQPGVQPRGTGLELAAVLMLTAGSLLPVLGWLLGVGLLWASSLWRVREKLLGTLVVPLGPGGVFLAGAVLPYASGQVCSSTGPAVVPNAPPAGAELPAPPPPTPGELPLPPLPPPPPYPLGEIVTCSASGPPGWVPVAVAAVLIVAPVVVAVVLYRIAGRRAAARPVAAAVPGDAPPPTPSPWGGLELAAVALLGIGGLLFPVVPPLVGLLLASLSPRWTSGAKAAAGGLLLLPVGAFTTFYVFGGALGLSLPGGSVLVLHLFGAAGGLLAATLLAVQLARAAPPGR